jgi:acetyl-CoA synthetase
VTGISQLSDDALADLNLVRDGTGYRIVWGPDANIYAMTLGRHLGPESRDRPALIFEQPDGQVITMTFADVERAGFTPANIPIPPSHIWLSHCWAA